MHKLFWITQLGPTNHQDPQKREAIQVRKKYKDGSRSQKRRYYAAGFERTMSMGMQVVSGKGKETNPSLEPPPAPKECSPVDQSETSVKLEL